MRTKSKKTLAILITLVMVFGLFAAMPLTASAAPPVITSHPANQTAPMNGYATFSVTATGATSYRWQVIPAGGLEWADIPYSSTWYDHVSDATMYADINEPVSGAQYRCKVSNADGVVYSNPAELNVQGTPVITAQPANKTVPGGGTVIFSVTATGATSYKWQYSENNGRDWLNFTDNEYFKDATTATMTFKGVGNAWNGRPIRCIVSNNVGSTYTRPATLTVTAPIPAPIITIQPSNQSIAFGGTATFLVAANWADTYQWQYSANNGVRWDNFTENEFTVGATNDVLEFNRVGSAWNGRLVRCIVTNASNISTTSNTARIILSTPPVITSHPAAQNVAPDGTATFSVTATGAASYQWQIINPGIYHVDEGIRLHEDSVFDDLRVTTNYGGVATSTLTYRNVSAIHDGFYYRCKVTNSEGLITYSNAARLTVRSAPVGKTVTVGQPGGTLTAGVEGSVTYLVTTTGIAPGRTYPITVTGLPAGVTASASIRLSSEILTETQVALGRTSPVTGYLTLTGNTRTVAGTSSDIRVTIDGERSNAFTLTINRSTTKSVSVGPPSGYLTARTPGTVTYSVTTANIANRNYTVTVTGLPAGVTVQGRQMIIANNSGTLTLAGDATTLEGLTNNLKLTIDGVESGVFTLSIVEGSPPTSAVGTMDNFVKTNTYTPRQFRDINEDAWYGLNRQRAVALAFEYGLIAGDNDGNFNPNGNVTVAQAIAMASRVHRIYTLGDQEFNQGRIWYQVYVDYATANGIIREGEFTDFTREATRAEMVYIFANSLPASEFPEQNTVNSLPDVDSTTQYYESILMLFKAGVITGNDEKGTFNPGSNIIRADAAAIITRVILPELRASDRTYG